MDGRAFLAVAQRLSQESTEADWRTAAGRAYYALMLEARNALLRWGFTVPRTEQVHRFVRLHFLYSSDPDLKGVSLSLEELGKLRSRADYHIDQPGDVADPDAVKQANIDARSGLALLDGVDADGGRRPAAIAAMRKAFP